MDCSDCRSDISIHAPPAGSDRTASAASSSQKIFQSTLPLRGATRIALWPGRDPGISIHAPPAGSDCEAIDTAFLTVKFQSTLPLRGATHSWRAGHHVRHHFNPRSPCGERPLSLSAAAQQAINFNPRSPCGERPQCRQCIAVNKNFNPRSPCGERRFCC